MRLLELPEFTARIVTPSKKVPKDFEFGLKVMGDEPTVPRVPTFSEEQLKAAQQEYYRKGYTEGSEEGKKQVDAVQADVEQQLVGNLKAALNSMVPLFADYKATITQMQADTPRIALAIAKKIAGKALDENAEATITDVTTKCITTMCGEPKLLVKVHKDHASALETRLKAVAQAEEMTAEIVVQGDETIDKADCKVEWQHGEFARHTGQLWEEVERIVEELTVSNVHNKTQELDTLEETVNTEASKEE